MSELYAEVKTASEGLEIQSVAKDLGISCGLNLQLDASATMCLESVDTGVFQIGSVHQEESRHERESSRPHDETDWQRRRSSSSWASEATNSREMTWTQGRVDRQEFLHSSNELCVEG